MDASTPIVPDRAGIVVPTPPLPAVPKGFPGYRDPAAATLPVGGETGLEGTENVDTGNAPLPASTIAAARAHTSARAAAESKAPPEAAAYEPAKILPQGLQKIADASIAPAPAATAAAQGQLLLVSPEGAVTPFADEAKAQGAIEKFGYKPAPPALQAEYERQQAIDAKEGGAGGAATNFLLNLDPTGLARWGARGTGVVTPEEQEAAARLHPLTGFLGTGASIALPGLAEWGLGKAGLEGAAGAASWLNLPAKAGEATTAGLKGLAGEGATSLIGKYAPGVAGSAVEGVGYVYGAHVGAEALDPTATIQSALASGGLNDILFGAAIGGGLGAVGGLAHATLGGLGSEGVNAWLKDYEATRNLKLTGATKVDFRKAFEGTTREDVLAQGREGVDLGIVKDTPNSLENTPEKILDRADAAKQASGEALGNFVREADNKALLNPEAMVNGESLLARLRSAATELRSNPFEQAAAKKIDEFADYFKANMDNTAERLQKLNPTADLSTLRGKTAIEDIWKLRQQLDDKVWGYGKSLDPDATPISSALKGFRGDITGEMERAINASGSDAAEWKQLNRVHQVSSTFAKFATKGLEKAGNNEFSLLESLGALAGFVHSGPAGLAGAALFGAAHRYGGNVEAYAARAARKALDTGAPELERFAQATREDHVPPPAPPATPAAPGVSPVGPGEIRRMRAAGIIGPYSSPREMANRGAKELDRLSQPGARGADGKFMSKADIEDRRALAQRAVELGKAAETARNNAIGRDVDFQNGARAASQNTPEQIAALAYLERQQNRVGEEFSKWTQNLKTGKRVMRTSTPNTDDVLKTVKAVNALINDPSLLAQRITASTGDIAEHAPQAAQEGAATAGRAAAYLGDAVSKVQPSQPYPLGAVIRPQRSDVIAFHQKVEAVVDPIKSIQSGVNTVNAEAIQAVYPALWKNLRSMVIAEMAKAPEYVYSPAAKKQIGIILGQNVSPGDDPMQAAMNASAYAQAAAAAQAAAGAKQRVSVKTRTPAELLAFDPNVFRTF